jgi:hypothetical protein
MRVVRASGVESEMELAFAVLHQLCAPLLDRLEGLPAPQRRALEITFGLSEGPAPDRFFVGLAVLGLLSEAAEERQLLCVIDDAQWLDRASAQALAFVARRLQADSVVMLFAAREPSDQTAGLPELVLEGLRGADGRALLASVLPGRLDERIADELLAETRGNPLALLELPRGLTAAQLAGGFGLPEVLPLEGRIEDRFLQRLEALSRQSSSRFDASRLVSEQPGARGCLTPKPVTLVPSPASHQYQSSPWDLRRRRCARSGSSGSRQQTAPRRLLVRGGGSSLQAI